MHTELSIDMTSDDADPLDVAWLDGDLATVDQLARRRVAEAPSDPSGHGWLGLVLFMADRAPLAAASLGRAFELWRALEAGSEPDEQEAIRVAMNEVADRLIDAVGEDEVAGLAAAQLIVDTLKLEHPGSLRMLAEHTSSEGGDPVKAVALVKRALVVDPADPHSHYFAARLFARVGRKPNVLSHLQKAIEHGGGTLAVRALAKSDPDFDGFRADPEFAALVDPLPADPALRGVYAALEAGQLEEVVELASAAAPAAAHPLDLLYPWRDALQELHEQGAADDAELEALQAQIEQREERQELSPAYSRYSGEV